MSASQFLKTRVSPETKQRVRVAAARAFVTESGWLKRLVAQGLVSTPISNESQLRSGVQPVGRSAREPELASSRFYVRLRLDDCLLLRERASARHMAAATYLSVLARAHLRSVAPVPKQEFQALKEAIAELAAIRRKLNEVSLRQGGRANIPGVDDVRTLLRVCEAMRDHVKSLLAENLNSWKVGYASRDS
jgi:hypothetical protein